MLFIEKRRLLSFFMFVLIGVEIFYVSSISGSKGVAGNFLIPIIYHFSVFFLFSFFAFFFVKGKDEIKSGYAIFVLLFSLAYAISDEFHQSFIPLRSPSLGDIIIDLIGISFSILISIFMSKESIRSR